MKYLISLLFCIFILNGCATTTTGPTPAGKDTWVMSRQEGAFPSGNEPLLHEVLEEAEIFCNKEDKAMQLINSDQNSGAYVAGNYPTATITFLCEGRGNYGRTKNNSK